MKRQIIFTDFAWGFIFGFMFAIVVCGAVAGLIYVHQKSKELNIYVEKQIEIEALHEDYSNRTVDELLEIPNVRRVADDAGNEFIRRRDDLLLRFRSRIVD